MGVDPVEIRESPRPAACKEKKTHFPDFHNPINRLIINYLHSIEIGLIFNFFNLFLSFFALFLQENPHWSQTKKDPFGSFFMEENC